MRTLGGGGNAEKTEDAVVADINLPQRFANAHRVLTYSLQSARHRLGWMGSLKTDAEIDAYAANAVAKMEALQKELLELVPDFSTLSDKDLKAMLQKRNGTSKRWVPKVLNDCYTRHSWLAEMELPPPR